MLLQITRWLVTKSRICHPRIMSIPSSVFFSDSSWKSTFLIRVITGDRPFAGTDAQVFITLYDNIGAKTSPFKLDVAFRDDFERGTENSFEVNLPPGTRFGVPKKIYVEIDSYGIAPCWFVDVISVQDQRINEQYVFPVFRWIRPHQGISVWHLDTFLPQQDPEKQQRRNLLSEKAKLYQLGQAAPGLPCQVLIGHRYMSIYIALCLALKVPS